MKIDTHIIASVMDQTANKLDDLAKLADTAHRAVDSWDASFSSLVQPKRNVTTVSTNRIIRRWKPPKVTYVADADKPGPIRKLDGNNIQELLAASKTSAGISDVMEAVELLTVHSKNVQQMESATQETAAARQALIGALDELLSPLDLPTDEFQGLKNDITKILDNSEVSVPRQYYLDTYAPKIAPIIEYDDWMKRVTDDLEQGRPAMLKLSQGFLSAVSHGGRQQTIEFRRSRIGVIPEIKEQVLQLIDRATSKHNAGITLQEHVRKILTSPLVTERTILDTPAVSISPTTLEGLVEGVSAARNAVQTLGTVTT